MAGLQQGAKGRAADAARDARRCADAGNLDGLQEIVEHCLAERETDFAIPIALFEVAMDASQYDLALRLASRAMELAPERAVGHYKRAVAQQALSQLADAEQGYLKAIELDASFGKALNNLGCLYLQREDRRAASEAFRQAIAADPTIAEPHNNLGQLLLESPTAELAPDCFRRAIAIDPGYAVAHLNLNQSLLNMGRNDEAMDSHRQALAVDRDGNLELRLALMIPEFMESREAIDLAREHMATRLAAL